MKEKFFPSIEDILNEPCNISGEKPSAWHTVKEGPTGEAFLIARLRRKLKVSLQNAFIYSEGVGLYIGTMVTRSKPIPTPTDAQVSEEIYKIALKKIHNI